MVLWLLVTDVAQLGKGALSVKPVIAASDYLTFCACLGGAAKISLDTFVCTCTPLA